MRKVLKWLGIGLSGLVALALVAGTVLYFVGRKKLGREYRPGPVVAAAADPAAAARGEHLARILACTGCHGEGLGGKRFLDIPPMRLNAPNLTRGKGGVGAHYTAAQWDAAVRYGVKPSGRMVLPFMPYAMYNNLSDADAAAIAAYLSSLPPVHSDTIPPTKVRLPGYMMVATMNLEKMRGDLDGPRRAAPPPAGTAEWGQYFASSICVECHGEKMQGGQHPAPDAPPGPGMAAAATWSREQFARTLRTGVTPQGRKLDEWMPSQTAFRHLTDEEIAGLHLYIQRLYPPRSAAPAAAPAGQAAGAPGSG
ncbi:MAG TPA: cytochrome c [Longimicrobium sp.]|nr:cytochrome c [Longimicrobium sp.]